MGVMNLEEIQNADTITGSHVDELVFNRPVFEEVDGKKGIMMADKYSLEAMTVPDKDDELEEVISSDDEDDLDALFS
ncbi:hypothetical protein [Limosilactobacillus reuteri]|uniref:hypothetical protein n=1 Tax=Limosilactobacillus reuteri TaxID=1598 RepID=UPI001E3A0269|nr:hypothetical protein [Limosilactobacillus reuteri]MCC4466442.1 hypothetical protein [Limosilactobacillus reuteri]MCC4474218.1 hypothetical protein [Limosilactobacillus reuteri]